MHSQGINLRKKGQYAVFATCCLLMGMSCGTSDVLVKSAAGNVSSAEAARGNRRAGRGPNLILILRGEAFRDGTEYSRSSCGNEQEQVSALKSARQHVFDALTARGWSVWVHVDAVVHESRDCIAEASSNTLPALTRPRLLYKQCTATFGEKLLMFRWTESVAPSMRLGMHQSLEYALSAAHNESLSVTAVLVTRLDLFWKRSLLFPAPPEACQDPRGRCVSRMDSANISVPFFHNSQLPSSTKLVSSDTLVFIPIELLPRFNDFLLSEKVEPGTIRRHSSLHNLATVFNVSALETGGMWRSDSHKEWNPWYRIIGRTEARKPPVHS